MCSTSSLLFDHKLLSSATDALARRGFLQGMKNLYSLHEIDYIDLVGIGTCLVTADTVVTVSTVVTTYTVGTAVTSPTEPGVGFSPTEQAQSER